MYPIKLKIANCNNLDKFGDYLHANSIKLVLFAETHGLLNENPIQEKLIREIKPNFFLYEMLEESKICSDKSAKIFFDKPNNKNFSIISTYGELKPTLRIARKFKLPLIG